MRAIAGQIITFTTDPPFAVNGVPTDPTTVKFVWSVSGGAETTWTYQVDNEVVKDSTGIYHVNLDSTPYPSQTINAKFVSLGVCQTVGEISIDVDAAVPA
jgi:hypothetical protein